MRYRLVGDVSHLSPHANGPASPLWWGMIGMIAIESAVFAILIASYFYLAHGSVDWPLGGIEPPKLLLPTVNTGVLLLSTIDTAITVMGIEPYYMQVIRGGLMLLAVLLDSVKNNIRQRYL